jgi:hypothetical protein
MPNWSSNALIVKSNGSKEGERDLDVFMARVRATKEDETFRKGLFNAFVPIDQNLYMSEAWYDWCCENWGTKWEVSYNNITFVSDTHITFETAWAPPTKWLLTASKEFPRLIFELAYSEQGMAFAGVQTIQDGEILSEDEVNVGWQFDEEEWCEENPDKDYDYFYENVQQPLPEWKAHMEKYGIGEGG